MVSVVTSLAVALVVMSIPLFVAPASDGPQRADAVVVFAGSGDRVQEGLRLVREDYAPHLLLSDAGLPRCPQAGPAVVVTCFTPNPFSTQGEAEFVAAEAKREGWHRILVVVGTPQITRARVRVDRCYSGQALYIGVSPGGVGSWLENIGHEWGALAEALVLQTSC